VSAKGRVHAHAHLHSVDCGYRGKAAGSGQGNPFDARKPGPGTGRRRISSIFAIVM